MFMGMYDFTHYYDVFIADFEQVNADWEAFVTSFKNVLRFF